MEKPTNINTSKTAVCLNNDSQQKNDLSSAHISDKKLALLMVEPDINTNFMELDLSYNNISYESIKHLANHIIKYICLTSLDLSSNPINCDGFNEICKLLFHLPKLMSLKINLTWNLEGDKAVKQLCVVLRNKPSLTKLELGHIQMSSAGASELLNIMQTNRSLTYICLSGNFISQKLLKDISQFTKRNEQEMLSRRREFIFKMIVLTICPRFSYFVSQWFMLPLDIKLIILKLINYDNTLHIGKNQNQISMFLDFIFDNIQQLQEMIQKRDKILILEKRCKDEKYHYRFFKHQQVVETDNEKDNKKGRDGAVKIFSNYLIVHNYIRP